MKLITLRLPDELAAEIESESHKRKISKSEIVRERLGMHNQRPSSTVDSVADLIGSVDGLPPDLSANKKRYLRVSGYGKKRSH